jgi:hypothetical protein
MDPLARCAFVQAQVACAMAEIAAMQAANQDQISIGQRITYDEAAFFAVQDKYLIGHNAVIDYLRN